MRILGLINAHSAILGAILLGLITLLGQDRQLFRLRTATEMAQFLVLREKFLAKALINLFTYLRFDFHPAQRDNSALYRRILASSDSVTRTQLKKIAE